ncbi:hypothetical protein [Streptomyces sp. NPDC046859]|uniref:hypothetical protein n=1 Tax=Streptomyces sp. NPDC046859 TaxID=3155734 RepID=UPI0033D94ADD
MRKQGEPKTRRSRRTIALPQQVVDVLEEHMRWQRQERASRGMEWSPTGRVFTSFVSLLSDHGIPWERIVLLVGHSSQATTEAVYRKQLRPVITQGAEATDDIFAEDQEGEAAGDDEEGDAVA